MCYQKPLSCFMLWRGKEKTALKTRIPYSSHVIPLVVSPEGAIHQNQPGGNLGVFLCIRCCLMLEDIRSTWQGWSRCFLFQCCLDRVILMAHSTSREVCVCTRKQWNYRESIDGGKLSPGGFGAQHHFLGCNCHLTETWQIQLVLSCCLVGIQPC